ncbi:MAG TPA: DUF503 domain-containing protein [Acidobacteriota bacterium]|nr:DUF503 domain-containing protein [Acidobacteriota bacterium]HNT18759.1 DUF503 domain-containing protein [Acidobacteriota bacterium]HQO21307.1 DUF503 domain-containing protein [Acidobacteriota bacterium]HQQ47972.1 DUF503 domain-containing protein [Acidobacteriota bacterium]
MVDLPERAVVAVIRLDFRLPYSGSLKDKRSVVRSFKEKARSRFSVCVVESGKQDLADEASLTLASVSCNGEEARKVLKAAVEFLEDNYPVQVTAVIEEVF